jgi:predicted anti-sigma-YlaC factor YlaD
MGKLRFGIDVLDPKCEGEAVTCREITEFLMDYLSGDLQGQPRAVFEEHLALCPNCVAFVRTYVETIRMSRSVSETPAIDPPEDLIRAILAARSIR